MCRTDSMKLRFTNENWTEINFYKTGMSKELIEPPSAEITTVLYYGLEMKTLVLKSGVLLVSSGPSENLSNGDRPLNPPNNVKLVKPTTNVVSNQF